MKECLDEAMLQSYFDRELSSQAMERSRLHLASCASCAAAARELEEESALLMSALAPEFETTVPTERLRHKIDAAVAGLHVVRPATEKPGLSAFLSSLTSFLTLSPQRTFGYASLVVMLALAGIFGVVKLRTRTADTSVAVNTPGPVIRTTSDAASANQKTDAGIPPVPVSSPERVVAGLVRPQRIRPTVAAKPAAVKLLPGERSYLQTIAKLDTAIKSEKPAMRPALQVEYERNLAVVDRAIAATRSAAKSNPTDPDAAEFMFAAYQSKVDLLNTIADARLGGRSH